ELALATNRTALLALLGWWIARSASRSVSPARRAGWAGLLPLLVIVDLLGAHWVDVPTVDPRYWTESPESVRHVKADPSVIRVFGLADKSAGERGYASERVNFLEARDPLDWSLSLAWDLASSNGNTPMRSRRVVDYTDHTRPGRGRFDLESVTHIVTGRKLN